MEGKDAMKILAFDQATQKTGYALFEDKVMCEYGLINLSREKDYELRSPRMLIEIYHLIEQHKPDLVLLENVAMQRSAGSLIKVSCILGGALGYCYEHGYSVEVLAPSTWRKALGFKQGHTVRGNLKEQAQKLVHDTFGLKVTEDEADAICIGLSAVIRDVNMGEAPIKE